MFENGSEIVRIDCHLHTEKDKEFSYTGDPDWYVSNYVEALEAQNIKIGIITNHNKFDLDEYKKIKKAASKKSILILPGVELSVKEGAGSVHTLLVFNPDEWISGDDNHISRVIDALFLGVTNPGDENTHCGKDLMTCIQELDHLNKDYFMIFAHVEQKSGLWKECGGAILSSLANKVEFRRRALGFQKVRTADKIEKVHNWMKYDIAHVEGSDPKCIDDIGIGQKKCFVKIGELSYSAVKYALKDYDNRVFTEKPNILHGYIKKMECIGGKLNRQVFCPSTELNTLIGIRGSGKSSILEVLRYGLNIDAAKPDNDYKNDLVKSVLSSGGQVEITIVDKYKREYTIKRILGESPIIIDETKKVLNVPVSSVIKNPLYFGQKDLALTRAGYELELLNKLVDADILDQSDGIKYIVDRLIDEISKYKEITDIPRRLADIETRNSELQYKLKIYREKGVDEKLKKQTSCNEDLIRLDSIYKGTEEMLNSLEEAFSQDNIQNITLGGYESQFNVEIFEEVKEHTYKTTEIFHNIGIQIELLRGNLSEILQTREKLIQKIASLKEEFAQIKREINDDTIDIDSFVSYQKQLASNNEELKRLKVMLKDKETLKGNIKALFNERNSMLQKCFQAYECSIEKINNKQDQLQIGIEFKGNRMQFKTDLKRVFKGTGLSEIKYSDLVDSFSDFVAIVEDYYLEEGKRLQSICTANVYAKVAEKIEDFYADCLGFVSPDAIKITYHGKPLGKHSIGQRASALILFILTQNDSDVIIIDQPEDDLDNQVIYKELIRTIKAEKREMQFIFATHNANIPVLGDAERVVTVKYDAENDRIFLQQGTIDSKNTHESIINIMEGGKEAFRKRNEIYTAW